MSTSSTTTSASAETSSPAPCKVFVGNLAFQTTDQALSTAFQSCGSVLSGVVITRGRRSLGYGFVEFTTPAEAEEAVNTMNNYELSGRQLKVEHVRDPSEMQPRPRRQRPSGGDANIASNNSQSSSSSQNVNQNSGGGGQQQRGGGRGAGGGGQGGQQQQQGGSQGGNNNDNNRRRNPRSRRRRGGATNPSNTRGGNNSNWQPADNNNAPSGGNTNQGSEGVGKPRRRNRRVNSDNAEEQPEKEKILSKTAVFVSNLPFSVKDEQLLQIFSDFKVKTAHVVVTRTGRSRGYGFVEFNSEDDQKAAIEKMNNASVKGNNDTSRNISVSVSHSAPATEGDDDEKKNI